MPRDSKEASYGQSVCYKNCVKKHSQAFDTLIDLFTIKEIHKPLHKVFDVAGFTEMELSHDGDTKNLVSMIKIKDKREEADRFYDTVDQEYGDLKRKANI